MFIDNKNAHYVLNVMNLNIINIDETSENL